MSTPAYPVDVAYLTGMALYSVVRAEIAEEARGDARYALNSLRCLDCELMYVERRQYSCWAEESPTESFPLYGAGHRFEKAQVDALRAAAGEETGRRD